MKIVETSRTYCFKLTKRQMLRIMMRDERQFSRLLSLTSRVLAIVGVREVFHDPMFGSFIHVCVESEDPQAMATTLENVKKAIAQYVR